MAFYFILDKVNVSRAPGRSILIAAAWPYEARGVENRAARKWREAIKKRLLSRSLRARKRSDVAGMK